MPVSKTFFAIECVDHTWCIVNEDGVRLESFSNRKDIDEWLEQNGMVIYEDEDRVIVPPVVFNSIHLRSFWLMNFV